jgi:hypothetical protein
MINIPRRWRVVAIPMIAVLVFAALVIPGFVGGWAPLFHSACTIGKTVIREQLYAPAILANSPYGGLVFDNGTLPASLPGAPGYPNAFSTLGAPAWNGTAAGAFFAVNLTIYQSENVTAWGPGANSHCNQPYLFEYDPPNVSGGGGGVAFGPIPTPSHLSDNGEATSEDMALRTFIFSNGFTSSNAPNITTCGGAGQSLSIGSPSFTVRAPLELTGENTSASVILPFPGSFHYVFPANFGIWQVDNLSAPGGPGGGWAFSYSPCP